MATQGKHRSFAAKNSVVIKLRSARYDPAHNLVTLTPKKAFSVSKPVQLKINGSPPAGLLDSVGWFIDGDRDGQQGGSTLAVISRKGVASSQESGTLGTPDYPGLAWRSLSAACRARAQARSTLVAGRPRAWVGSL
jgi:hypothetical protein